MAAALLVAATAAALASAAQPPLVRSHGREDPHVLAAAVNPVGAFSWGSRLDGAGSGLLGGTSSGLLGGAGSGLLGGGGANNNLLGGFGTAPVGGLTPPAKVCNFVEVVNSPSSVRNVSFSDDGGCRNDQSTITLVGCHAWSPSLLLKEEWLELDMGAARKLKGVVTLGVNLVRLDAPGKITSLKVLTSLDGKSWSQAGSIVLSTVLKSESLLPAAVRAQFVRLVPLSWEGGRYGLRASLLVCAQEPDCGAGVEVNPSESQRRYSSIYRDQSYQSTASTLDSPFQWRFGIKFEAGVGIWMQIDLGSAKRAVGLITQGGHNGGWVTRYSVRQSMTEDTVSFQLVDRFPGNTDWDSKVIAMFPTPVDARYLRIYPLLWNLRVEMRAAVLACGWSKAEWLDAVKAARETAKSWVTQSSNSQNRRTLAKKWLGVELGALTELPEVARVKAVLASLVPRLDTTWFALPQPGALCYPGVWAYTGLGSIVSACVVQICEDFFSSEAKQDEQAAILLHEIAHCAGTTDLTYDREKSLALRDPDKTSNTNSYVYYVMEAAQAAQSSLRMPSGGIMDRVNCNSLSGTVCSQNAGVCQVRVQLMGQSCTDYCEVNNLVCKGAAESTSAQCSQGMGDPAKCSDRFSREVACWCKPTEQATWTLGSTTTTTPTMKSGR